MNTVLVTGFEPFGGDARNPSKEIATALDRTVVSDRRIVSAILPCVFGESGRALAALLREHRPELVVSLGVANGRSEITPERVAINVDDARIPDNCGAQPVDRAIVAGGPAAYWSSLPIKAIVARLRDQGIPAAVSQTAGTFVCNHLFYALMRELRRSRGARGGFIHVPWPQDWPEHPGSSISLEQMIAAVRTAIEVSAEVRE